MNPPVSLWVYGIETLAIGGLLAVGFILLLWSLVMLIRNRLLICLLAVGALALAGCQSDWTLATVGDVEEAHARIDGLAGSLAETATAAKLAGASDGEAALAAVTEGAEWVGDNPGQPLGVEWWIWALGAAGLGGGGTAWYRRKNGKPPAKPKK